LLDQRPLLVAGAHDGLSGRLVEEAGFDAVWASGFEISASHAVPDASVLTMAEHLEAARQINVATRIPVIADCDSGFGNAVNVIRTVQAFEAAGIAAVCIEDNVFPKRCSFYEDVQRELVPVEEHAGKIRAAKSAQRDAEFLVIARTEALVTGSGVEDALRRASAYADAGADAILVHSKAKDAGEVLEFAARWRGRTPLVAVPTTYAHVKASVLAAAGFRIVIFANHGLRAGVKASQAALNALRESGRADAADAHIVPLAEIYRLVGVSELQQDESVFLPKSSPVRAIVLAAGDAPHLAALTATVPKSLLEIRGRTILSRQVEALRTCGITRISVVRGHRKHAFPTNGLVYFDNDDYTSNGEAASLQRAASELTGRTLVLYGDIVFDPTVARRALDSPGDITIVVDRSWRDEAPGSRAPEASPDLVVERSERPVGRRYLSSAHPIQVARIGRDIPPGKAHSEFIGILSLSETGATIVQNALAALVAEAPRASLLDLIQRLIQQGRTVHAVETYKGWIEVDTVADYERAVALLQ
jgi:phosphoenolpyruvate phosphomutase